MLVGILLTQSVGCCFSSAMEKKKKKEEQVKLSKWSRRMFVKKRGAALME